MIYLGLIYYLDLLNSYYKIFFKITYFLKLFLHFYIYLNHNTLNRLYNSIN